MSKDADRRTLIARIEASVNERAIAIFAVCSFAKRQFGIDLDTSAAVDASATVDDVLLQLGIEIELARRCGINQGRDGDDLNQARERRDRPPSP